jgi:hypothetical protein
MCVVTKHNPRAREMVCRISAFQAKNDSLFIGSLTPFPCLSINPRCAASSSHHQNLPETRFHDSTNRSGHHRPMAHIDGVNLTWRAEGGVCPWGPGTLAVLLPNQVQATRLDRGRPFALCTTRRGIKVKFPVSPWYSAENFESTSSLAQYILLSGA